MAHKNQHIVPRCYLKNFVRKETNRLSNIHHKNGIFVNDKFLKGEWKEKGLDNNLFTRSYFYNLQIKDKTEKLVVEKYLSNIEHLYEQSVNSIKKGQIAENDIDILKIFLHFQYLRTPSFMSMMQNTFDRVAGWADDFSGNNDATKKS